MRWEQQKPVRAEMRVPAVAAVSAQVTVATEFKPPPSAPSSSTSKHIMRSSTRIKDQPASQSLKNRSSKSKCCNPILQSSLSLKRQLRTSHSYSSPCLMSRLSSRPSSRSRSSHFNSLNPFGGTLTFPNSKPTWTRLTTDSTEAAPTLTKSS